MGRFDTIAQGLRARGLSLAAALALTLALGGCGGGVEFQGKLFDYAGLSGSSNPDDVKMSQRPPLILPPDTNKLPPPGQGVANVTARPDWPSDTDQARKQAVATKEAEQQKAEAKANPTNPYAGKPTLLDKVFGKDSENIEIVDVPEPDPSDKRPEDRAREQGAVASTAPKPLTPAGVEDTPPEPDPFHKPAPKSYEQMSNPTGNRADY